MLSEGEQTLLRRLSVFAGGWTLGAAEAVCADARDEGKGTRDEERQGTSHPSPLIPHPSSLIPEDVLDLLTSLVDKSLVTYEDEGGEGRYRLLETVRQYARDRLLEAGVADTVRGRHLDWCLALVGRSRPTWMPAWRAERPDDGRWALVEQRFAGESETARLERLEREHDNLRVALAWSGAHGQAEADKQGIAYSLGYLGLAARGEGDSGTARALNEKSLAIFRELGNKAGTAWSLNNLGWMARDRGESGAARAFFEESLAICRELGDKRGIAQNLEGIAALAMAQARPERAAHLFGAAEGLREAMGAPRPPADRAEHDRCVAAVRAALGEAGTREARFGREADMHPPCGGYPGGRAPGEAGGPGPGFAAAWAEGRAMSLDEAVCVALSLHEGD